MLEYEIDALCKELVKRWPGLKPDDTQLTLWRTEVFRDRNYRTMLQAMQAAWLQGKYTKIQPASIIRHYDVFKTRDTQQQETDTEPPAWIQCVEAPADFPGRLGRIVAVFAEPNKDDPHDWLANIAGQMRRLHEQMCGGRWEIAFGKTFDEMDTQKRQLQAEAR